MTQGKVDVLRLVAKGKTKVSERAGTISLKAADPVGALQAIARQGSIRIELTKEEVTRIRAAGKLDIFISYANHVAGATEAAKKVLGLAENALASQARNTRPGIWKILGIASVLLIAAAAVFAMTYKFLQKTYG